MEIVPELVTAGARCRRWHLGGTLEPIAIVGMACRLPGGVRNPEDYWSFLKRTGDAITLVPDDRWSLDAHYADDLAVPGRANTKFGGFIDGIDRFDCRFFGISPREAARMDPQQRLFLETGWDALENAGIAIDRLGSIPVGVFVGISYCDYAAIQGRAPTMVDGHTASGSALSMVATRLSHRLGLTGPSLAIDTACSSSLVAVDTACRSIWTGECEMALAGGVNLMLSPETMLYLSKAAMLSPEGRCRMFDAGANGYVRGEGLGAVILKPLSKALRDGDRIEATILSSLTGQDGHTISMTEPSAEAQARLMRSACAAAGVSPETIVYVEAHGTGTPIGDPIEARAITTAYCAGRDEPLLVGSVKTNFGHLESAAGIAGLLKAVLCVRNGAVPPNLHFAAPNPAIDLRGWKLTVPTSLTPLSGAGPDGEIRAAVNSFGFGGTNAHVILAGPPPPARRRRAKPVKARQLVPISAASEEALSVVATGLAGFVRTKRNVKRFDDIASTLALRRSHLEHRALFIAKSGKDLAGRLTRFAAGDRSAALATGRRADDPGPVFVFCGQGAQWAGMAKSLIATEEVFRKKICAVDKHFVRLAGWSIAEALEKGVGRKALTRTERSQPLIFAIQVGFAASWKASGITPAAVVGHSLGEIAAAHVCGALSLRDAVTVIYHRSRLQQRLHGQGGMLHANISEAEFHEGYANDCADIVVAAHNSPWNITLAGRPHDLYRLRARLVGDGHAAQRLDIDYAFHSEQMEPLRWELVESLRSLRPKTPSLPMISTVTGDEVEPGELTAAYWWQNVRSPVHFAEATVALVDQGYRTFVDMGPSRVLSAAIFECLEHRATIGNVLPSMVRNGRGAAVFETSLAQLFCGGQALDWRRLHSVDVPPIDLPSYPWQGKRHWQESEESRDFRLSGPDHVLLGVRQRAPNPTWLAEISLTGSSYLSQHRLGKVAVFPATGFIEMIRTVAETVLGPGRHVVAELRLEEALNLHPERPSIVMTSFVPDRQRVEIFSRGREETDWLKHATARIALTSTELDMPEDRRDIPREPVSPESLYSTLRNENGDFGPAFRGITAISCSGDDVFAEIRATDLVQQELDGYMFHPAYLDCCLHAARGFLPFADNPPRHTAHIPYHCEMAVFHRRPGDRITCHLRKLVDNEREVVLDLDVLDSEETPVAQFRRLAYRRFHFPPSLGSAPALYRSEWQEKPLVTRAEATPQKTSAGGAWLVLADRGGLTRSLKRALGKGTEMISVHAGSRFRQYSDTSFCIRANLREDLVRLLKSLGDRLENIRVVVHAWSLDAPKPATLTAELIQEGESLTGLSALHLMQELARGDLTESHDPVRLWLLTRNARGISVSGAGDAQEISVLPGVLTGFGRVLFNEVPRLAGGMIDIDEATGTQEIVSEILEGDGEIEIAYRGRRRFINRIAETSAANLPGRLVDEPPDGGKTAFRLETATPGMLERLVLRETESERLGPNQVGVAVRAAGLNFRDVMAALGVLPDRAEETPAWGCLGIEAAGIISAVGDAVTDFELGDRVALMCRGSFASDLIVDSQQVFPIGNEIGFIEAATIPVAYLTADIALNRLGGLRAGEKVLIHSATGGVGLAAIALCKIAGAEIFATAGSAKKRACLRSLGIAHVYNSRTADFADNVLSDTDSQGVDIVLNSLSGELRDRSLEILGPFGRFLEIGKADIYLDRPISALPFRRNIQFIGLDLGQIAAARPELIRESMRNIMELIEVGKVGPLPAKVFRIDEADRAFRYMSQARHIGKIVLSFDVSRPKVFTRAGVAFQFKRDASYLVTGGTSGFGARVARWMADRGAGRLVLVSRSSNLDPASACLVDDIRRNGVGVSLRRVDVTDTGAVSRLIAEIEQGGPPLRGIVHAAAVYDDAPINDLDGGRLRKVLRPKTVGAWNLHQATQRLKLDFFLLFGSLAAELGAPSQSNYAAANSFLTSLAKYRRQIGQPGLAISWGSIGEVGFVARNTKIGDHLERLGILKIDVDQALAVLDDVIARDIDSLMIAKVDWEQLSITSWNQPVRRRLDQLITAKVDAGKDTHERLRSELSGLEPKRASKLLQAFLCKEIAALLRVSVEEIDPTRPLDEIGLDSLSSVDLKIRLEAFGVADLPISLLRKRLSIDDLVAFSLKKI